MRAGDPTQPTGPLPNDEWCTIPRTHGRNLVQALTKPPTLRWAAAFALAPLMLVGPVSTPAAATARLGGGWSGLWLSNESTSTNGTSLKDVRTIIGASTGAAANLTGAG